MPKYFDSHCHLPDADPFADMFARAKSVGIVGCVINSMRENDWQQIIDIASNNENVVGAIGVHPWYADSVSTNWLTDMESILSHHPNIVLGEVGLDKTRDNFDAQERIFIQSLEMAIKYNRVLNLHCVHAWDRVLNILKSYKNKLPKIVVHAFDGTQNAIDFDENLYFSVSPNISKPNYNKIKISVGELPKNKILLESDSSNLLPVLTAAAGLKSLRPEITDADIYNNTMGVFFNGQITQN